jgi:hypothetical protein
MADRLSNAGFPTGSFADWKVGVTRIANQLCSAFPLLWGGLREEWAGAERFRVGAQICDLSVTQS